MYGCSSDRCVTKDLNYESYFSEGIKDISKIEEYHSHNTIQLDVEETKTLLLKLDMVRNDLEIK